EDNRKVIKETITPTNQKVPDHKANRHRECISVGILDKIKERRSKTKINNSRTKTEKAEAQAKYAEANNQVKKIIKSDKQKYVRHLAMTAKKPEREGNMRHLYDTTKKQIDKNSKPFRSTKNKDGKPLSETQEQRNSWANHFEELLNRLAPLNLPVIEAAATDLPIDTNPLTIKIAIRHINSGKSAGPDNIPDEVLKSNIEVTSIILHTLFRKIWEEEQVPTDWKENNKEKRS
ncbi:hypothetical protein MN116_000050, partial [Schistosoma mekongi]